VIKGGETFVFVVDLLGVNWTVTVNFSPAWAEKYTLGPWVTTGVTTGGGPTSGCA
jgi:hypothetical protein